MTGGSCLNVRYNQFVDLETLFDVPFRWVGLRSESWRVTKISRRENADQENCAADAAAPHTLGL